MSGRPEGGGGSGLPDEWFSYGDREHVDWVEWDRPSRDASESHHQHATPQQRGELEVPTYRQGDRVKARNAVSGGFLGGTTVPQGTRGRVVSTRDGVFTSYVTVAFDNGYTEEVKKSALSKVGWFD